MHNVFGPGRHSAISKGAAAPPPQPEQEIASLERIFADSQETALRDCEAAADESKRAEHRKTAVSGTQSLMAKASAVGAPVTRPAPDAPTASARSGAKAGGAAQDGPGPRDAAAPRPQAKAREECVIVIDDDDCIDIGLETSSSGGTQATPLKSASAQAAAAAHEDAQPAAPATCTAQGAPGTGAAAAPMDRAAPKGPGASRAAARAAPKGPDATGAAAPAHLQAKADPQDPPLFEDDDLFDESGPEALRSDGAPDSPGGMAASSRAAPAQAAPPTAPQAAPAKAASSQAIPQAASAQAGMAADQAAANAAGGAAAALPQQPAPQPPCAAANAGAGHGVPGHNAARVAQPSGADNAPTEPHWQDGAHHGSSPGPAGSAAAQRCDACGALREPHWRDGAHHGSDPGPAGSVAERPGGAGGAPTEPRRRDGAHHGSGPGPAGSVAEHPGGAGGAPIEPRRRDGAHHGSGPGPAGSVAEQPGGAGGAPTEPRRRDGAHRDSDPGLAGAAGPNGDWRAQAHAPIGAGAFDDEWDAPPDVGGGSDGWEADDGADDIGESGAAPDGAARDRHGGAHACNACGRRRGGPRFGRWLAASLLAAAAAAVMVWTGGDGIGRLSGWRADQPAPVRHGAPDGAAGEIRRMAADAIDGAPGETPPTADPEPVRRSGDGAEDLRSMIADALDEDRAPHGAGSGPAESAQEGGVDAPETETAAAADVADAADPVDAAGVRLARIERRLGDAERGAVSTGGLIGTLGAAIADAATRMEAIERDRASLDSRLADLELRTAEADRAGDRAAGLGARLDETDTVVLDLAARVAALEAEADAGAVDMIDAPVGADAPGWIDDWGPDPFAADGPRTQWDNSVDDNPVYRRIPAAARLVRGKDGRITPEFVETPANDASDSAAAAPQGG